MDILEIIKTEPGTISWKDRYAHFRDFILPNFINLKFDPSDYLCDKCFFAQPASTKYHGAYEGGLFDHSLMVMETLVKLTEDNNLKWNRPESPYIVGFFHDLCKTDQYIKAPGKPQKDGSMLYGENLFHYEFDAHTLYKGHGDKSVIMLSSLLKLTEEEAACIRYHMGAYTEKEEWEFYGRAIERFPNVLWTHHADMIASKIEGV